MIGKKYENELIIQYMKWKKEFLLYAPGCQYFAHGLCGVTAQIKQEMKTFRQQP